MDESAQHQKLNPQAHVALGLMFASGLMLAFGIFFLGSPATSSIAGCLFILSTVMVWHFWKKEKEPDFIPSPSANLILALMFGLFGILGVILALVAVTRPSPGSIFQAIQAILIAFGLLYYSRFNFATYREHKKANQSVQTTAASRRL